MKKNLLLFLIVGLGFLLRIVNLGNIPATLNRDEAAIAYNAYLLSATGRDEWGKSWPVTLESFGDFKLPGYPLILVGLFKILPLSDGLVRLPSVLAGTLLIWLSYLWAQKIFTKSGYSWLVALLIAVTPVFFFYSRIAFEANLALSLMVAALYCWLLAKPNRNLDLLGLGLWCGAIFTYNTPFLLTPVILIILILRRGLVQWRRWILPVSGLVIMFLIFSLILVPLTGQKKGITIFTDETTWKNYIQYRSSLSPLLQKTVGNRWFYNARLMWNGLAGTFSYKFLVSRGGDHPWHALPGKGHLFLISYLLGWLGLLVAMVLLWRAVKNRRQILRSLAPVSIDTTLGLLLFSSLLPSIVTIDSPHATRSLLFFFIFAILGIRNLELSIELLVSWLKAKKTTLTKTLSMATTLIVIILIAVEGTIYFYRYFFFYPTHLPSSLKPGLPETVQKIESDYAQQQVAYVDGQGFDYILVAWYGRVTPEKFFQTINKQLPDGIGFRYGDRLTHYHFIADPKDRVEFETVLVAWDGQKWSINQL